jgi:hypothetical protein
MNKGTSVYVKNQIFQIALFASNFIRDLLLAVIEIGLNIVLIVLLKRYFDMKKRRSVSAGQDSDKLSANNNKKIKWQNSVIALILCSLSSVQHCLTFSVLFILLF